MIIMINFKLSLYFNNRENGSTQRKHRAPKKYISNPKAIPEVVLSTFEISEFPVKHYLYSVNILSEPHPKKQFGQISVLTAHFIVNFSNKVLLQ
jgi:hypothetical protein